MQSEGGTGQVNVQNWLNDWLCGSNFDDLRPDSIAVYAICGLLCLTNSLRLHALWFDRRRLITTGPTTLSVSTNQVNVQNWLNDQLCGLNSDDFLSDSIAIYPIAPGCV